MSDPHARDDIIAAVSRKPSAVLGVTQMLASGEPLLPVYGLLLLRTLIATERGRAAMLQSGIVEPLLEQCAVSEHTRCGSGVGRGSGLSRGSRAAVACLWLHCWGCCRSRCRGHRARKTMSMAMRRIRRRGSCRTPWRARYFGA